MASIAALISDSLAQLECESAIAEIAARLEITHEIENAIAECLAAHASAFECERSYVGPILAARLAA